MNTPRFLQRALIPLLSLGLACAHAADAHAHCTHDHAHGPGPATDPVCGMRVDPATAKHRATHDGTEFFFCSAGCRAKFVAEPAKHLAPKPAAPSMKAPNEKAIRSAWIRRSPETPAIWSWSTLNCTAPAPPSIAFALEVTALIVFVGVTKFT